jgi:hypothetical protein
MIVFDRRKGALAGVPARSSQTVNGISCVFTAPGVEADDEIIAMLRREKIPADVTVVTDDGKILNHCKALGAKTAHPSFLERTPAKAGKPVCDGVPKRLSPALENDITRWYENQLKK